MSDHKLSKDVVALVGPTATGKTALAFSAAEKICTEHIWPGVVIVSADSRQVYRGLEICTGVDLPPTWQVAEYFGKSGYQHPRLPIFLFGISLISPVEEWSVAHFREYTRELMTASFADGFLVLIVGGTGLYHEHLFSNDPGLLVPPDPLLRDEVTLMTVTELQQTVQGEAADVWEKMKYDDQQNPRRLIRVLEKHRATAAKNSVFSSQATKNSQSFSLSEIKHTTFGVTDVIDHLRQKISTRVNQRLEIGAVTEVEQMISKYSDAVWKMPAFSSTGCKEIRAYIEEQYNLDQLKELWIRREIQYAKRQLTWWKFHTSATTTEGFHQKKTEWVNLSQLDHAQAMKKLYDMLCDSVAK